MKKLSVWLFLSFCSCLLVYKATAIDVCTINDPPSIMDQLRDSTTSTKSFSAIITSYSLGCCGLVSTWSVLINITNRRSTEPLDLNFQVWRRQNQENCGYRLIGSTNATSSQATEKNGSILNVNATEDRIGFQIGDVIGISVQNTMGTLDSVRLRRDINRSAIILDQGSTHQQGKCVGLTASRITEIPIITAIIEPTSCTPTYTSVTPSIPTAPHTTPTSGGGTTTSKSAGLEGGIIAGIAISALLVVLLCAISTIVCLVLVFTKKSKRKKTRQKTFGKARFIRSVYMLPTLYTRAAKTDTAKEGSTEESLASTREEGEEGEREEEQQQQLQRGAEQEVETEVMREISNSDMYINQQEFTNSTDPLTPSEEVNDDENFYENNPLAWRYFRDKEKVEEKRTEGEREQDHEQDSTRDYVNKEMFTQLPPVDTGLSSNGIDASDEELYVNNLPARKKLKDLNLYDNKKSDISTTINRAYGVTERSDDLFNLMQPHEEPDEQAQEQSEANGEDEYVYMEVHEDSPEEEYEDMASFKASNITKKQPR